MKLKHLGKHGNASRNKEAYTVKRQRLVEPSSSLDDSSSNKLFRYFDAGRNRGNSSSCSSKIN